MLSLPADTEIARVRGVYGYQFPKWLADINLDMDNQGIKAGLTTTDGKSDLTLEAPLSFLKTIPSQSAIGPQASMVGPVFVVPNIGHDVQDALGHF